MNNDLATLFGGNPFDPSTVEPQGDFQVIPPGKYPVLIEEAEVKQTKAGTGHYVKLVEKILEGPYVNRKLFDQINVDNPSAQCVEIGLRTLSALGRAIGLTTITDTAQLLNQVVIAHVKVKGDQNEIRTYSEARNAVDAANSPETYPPPQQAIQEIQRAITVGQQSAPAVGGTVTTPSPAPSGPTEKPPWLRS